MHSITLHTIGAAVKKQRGDNGIREVAKQIEISPATLSRIENGKLPDLETFSKLCRWLSIDPAEILGCSKSAVQEVNEAPSFHFKADKTLGPNAAKALAEMILAAQKMFSN